MKAEEIRNRQANSLLTGDYREAVYFLAEIAAQLAELNECLRQAQGPNWVNSLHITVHKEE